MRSWGQLIDPRPLSSLKAERTDRVYGLGLGTVETLIPSTRKTHIPVNQEARNPKPLKAYKPKKSKP